MNERGTYGTPQIGSPYFHEYTPGELAAKQLFPRGNTIGDPNTSLLLMYGGLGVLAVGGVLGVIGAVIAPKKDTTPVTTTQKAVRFGLVGSALGAGAYAYFSGK